MPFGPYVDFKDCVGKNQDKDNPEGFCAFLHERITGKFPAESAEQINASASVFNGNSEDLQKYAAALTNVNWFDEEAGKKIVGVEIFRSGSHTDSVGRARNWTKTQLTKLVANFKAGIPSISSIKLGHSSDEHTAKVAKELGLSPSILSGEGASGVGSAALGKVSDLHLRSDGTLIAEFDVPEKVAGMVEARVFRNVSAEIIDDYQGKGPVLSGLALLGAERPALKELAGLGNVTIMDDGSRPDHVYTFSLHPVIPPKPDMTRFKEDADKLFKFQAESVYNVPVTEESLDSEGRVTNRKVVVQHIRASTVSEARGAVLRTLERTLSAFGNVVGQGLGFITIAYASNKLARFIVGKPKKGETTSKESGSSRKRAPNLIDIVADRIFDERQDKSQYATNILIRGVITLGAFKLANELWHFILAHKESNARQPVRVWAASQDEAQGVINDNFERKTWDSDLVTTAIAAGLKSALAETVDDVQMYRFAGYSQGADSIYKFHLIHIKDDKDFSPGWWKVIFRDRSTGKTFDIDVAGIEDSTGLPTAKNKEEAIAIASGVEGGLGNLDVLRVIAPPESWGHFSDALYLFDRTNKRTRKPLKPHKHPHPPGQRQYLTGGGKGQVIAGVVGAAAIISPGSFLGPAKVVAGKRGSVIRAGIGATLRGAKGVGKISRVVANVAKKARRKKRPALAARFLQEHADSLFEFITNNDVRMVDPIIKWKKRRKHAVC